MKSHTVEQPTREDKRTDIKDDLINGIKLSHEELKQLAKLYKPPLEWFGGELPC